MVTVVLVMCARDVCVRVAVCDFCGVVWLDAYVFVGRCVCFFVCACVCLYVRVDFYLCMCACICVFCCVHLCVCV